MLLTFLRLQRQGQDSTNRILSHYTIPYQAGRQGLTVQAHMSKILSISVRGHGHGAALARLPKTVAMTPSGAIQVLRCSRSQRLYCICSGASKITPVFGCLKSFFHKSHSQLKSHSKSRTNGNQSGNSSTSELGPKFPRRIS